MVETSQGFPGVPEGGCPTTNALEMAAIAWYGNEASYRRALSITRNRVRQKLSAAIAAYLLARAGGRLAESDREDSLISDALHRLADELSPPAVPED